MESKESGVNFELRIANFEFRISDCGFKKPEKVLIHFDFLSAFVRPFV
jgi:hypothetical protein